MSHRNRYQQYRQAGQQLNTKILQAYADRELILDSAESLGIEHNGVDVEYDFKTDMAVHFEFLLYEYRREDQTPAEQYFEAERWETEIERTILEATLEAETSLFEITAIDESANRLEVTDLRIGGDTVSIVDINLGQTAEPGVLLFVRPVQYEEFTITSGVSFPFPAEKKADLLEECERHEKHTDDQSASRQRFITFYELYRDHGIRMQYN